MPQVVYSKHVRRWRSHEHLKSYFSDYNTRSVPTHKSVNETHAQNSFTGRYVEITHSWLIVTRHWFTVRGPLQPLASVHRVVLVDGRPQRAGQRRQRWRPAGRRRQQQVVFKCRMKMKSHRIFHLFRCVKKVCK